MAQGRSANRGAFAGGSGRSSMTIKSAVNSGGNSCGNSYSARSCCQLPFASRDANPSPIPANDRRATMVEPFVQFQTTNVPHWCN